MQVSETIFNDFSGFKAEKFANTKDCAFNYFKTVAGNISDSRYTNNTQ